MKVQEIVPINIWSEGTLVEVTKLGIEVAYDNLINTASFKYVLLKYYSDSDISINPIYTGYIVMDGQDYEDWNADPDINEAAVEWVADKLNLDLA